MSEKTKWINVRIPVDSHVNKAINNKGSIAAWKIIDEKFKGKIVTKEEKVNLEFDKFVDFTVDLYPGTKEKLNLLKPIILNKILKAWDPKLSETYIELKDDYFEILKKLLNNDDDF